MASIQIGVPFVRPGTIPPVYKSVWVKRTWTAAWQYVPYLKPVSAFWEAAPGISSARLRYQYGILKQADQAAFAYYSPVQLQGWYVAIWGHSYAGSAPLWIGVIGPQDQAVFGASAQGLPQGVQELTAYGLEWLLHRRPIDRAYVEAGVRVIDRTPAFNRRYRWGATKVQGNRSNSRNGAGVYTFSEDGAAWSHLDILEYVLYYFGWEAVPFVLAGDAWVLGQRVTEVDQDYGPTVGDLLNKLIDRKRGLGWSLVTSGAPGAPVYIHCWSVTQWAWWFDDIILPGNRNQVWLRLDGLKGLETEMSFNPVSQVDQIIIEGNPIKVVQTLRYSDGTLEPAWTSTEETNYKAGDDEDRKGEQYGNVYRKFRIPAAHDFAEAQPTVTWDGRVDPTTASGSYWRQGRSFLNWLPWEESSADPNAEPSMRKPFAAINASGAWHYLHDVSDEDVRVGQCSLELLDRELAVLLRGRINHVLALNHWAGAAASDTDPVFDWENLSLTLFYETDTLLRVRVPLWTGLFSETARSLVVRDETAEYWYSAPNTILDIQGGSPVYYADPLHEQYNVIRDDTGRLRALAVFLAAWYAQMRATISMTAQGIRLGFPLGTLIQAASSGRAAEPVGTVVTRMGWNFDGGATFVQTGYGELDHSIRSGGL